MPIDAMDVIERPIINIIIMHLRTHAYEIAILIEVTLREQFNFIFTEFFRDIPLSIN